MLRQTFCHLAGVGPTTEKRLWRTGITCWEDLLENHGSLPLRPEWERICAALRDSRLRLEAGDAGYFSATLPAKEQWRLFPEFRDHVVYLDIETTGLEAHDHITTIALYDGSRIRHYVTGVNLDQFASDIQEYRLLVTYNGRCFDVPFIEAQLGLRLNQAHIDLRYALKSLGYSGGLKACERQLGLSRGDTDGIDGLLAVRLWNQYRRTKRRSLLETLLAYNVQDVLTLEILMIIVYNAKLKQTPFYDSHSIASARQPANPFKADRDVLQRLAPSIATPWMV